MRIRYIATAFIREGTDWLLMKRADSCSIAPGYWYGLGGHLEEDEYSNPELAVRREIQEESGLSASQINQLGLRFVVMRRSRQEIVMNYVYTASALTRSVRSYKEGDLFWIKQENLLDRKYADVIRFVIEKLIAEDNSGTDIVELHGKIYAGIMNSTKSPDIKWIEMTDWPGIV